MAVSQGFWSELEARKVETTRALLAGETSCPEVRSWRRHCTAAIKRTQHLFNDLHAPMVTVILEEQALAPARAHAHADLAATVMVGLFDRTRLAVLPEALANYQKLGDSNVVARALLAQINYTSFEHYGD